LKRMWTTNGRSNKPDASTKNGGEHGTGVRRDRGADVRCGPATKLWWSKQGPGEDDEPLAGYLVYATVASSTRPAILRLVMGLGCSTSPETEPTWKRLGGRLFYF
jgi:hypothetical protein